MIGIITQIVIVFILIGIGYAANRLKILDANFNRKLSRLVILTACPCLVLSSVMGESVPQCGLILPLLLIGLLSHALLAVAGILLPRLFCRLPTQRGIYGFMIAFSNIGFVGYPVVAAIFGTHAVFYASILMLPYTLFAFTVGMSFVSGEKGLAHFDYHVLMSPIMSASMLAIVMVCTGMTDAPVLVSRPLQLVGGITVPVALLVIGSSLAEVPFSRMWTKKSLYAVSFLRLLLLPLLLYLLADALHFNQSVNRINTVLMAMPVSTYGTMFCYKAGRDDSLMTLGTCLSTLLSIVSIPLLTRLIL
ncbi:MAG: AEC family transporter [Muribaculaceae bacterium]